MRRKYKKYKNFIEKYLESSKGRRFFNFFYSWGATVVILGALFKIEHYSFGGYMLSIGMVVEAIVFFLAAFDTPPKEYRWEDVYPVLSDPDEEVETDENMATAKPSIQRTSSPSANRGGVNNIGSSMNNGGGSAVSTGVSGTGGVGHLGGTVIVGSGSGQPFTDSKSSGTNNVSGGVSGTVVLGGSGNASGSSYRANSRSEGVMSQPTSGNGSTYVGGASDLNVNEASERYVEQLSSLSENMEKFAKVTNSLTEISDTLLSSFKSITDNSEGINNNTRGYVNQMEALNRNVSGLNTIYEIQLKGVSGQINTIEEINAGLDRIKKLYGGSLADSSIFKSETEKMAQQLVELNRVYARMIQAMTTNMNMNNMGGMNNPPQ